MEKIQLIFKLGWKFSNKYYIEYIKLMLFPILIVVLGISLLFLIELDPLFAFLGLFITLPCIFYSFWKYYFISYAINPATYCFIKTKANKSIKECLNEVKKDEKNLIKYISYCAIITLIVYIPSLIYVFSDINSLITILANPTGVLSALSKALFSFGLTTLLLMPLLNFMTQSFYFRKKNESYFNLVLNCYKNLDKTGVMIILFIIVVNILLSMINPIISSIALFLLNLFVYSVNTLWFCTRLKNK